MIIIGGLKGSVREKGFKYGSIGSVQKSFPPSDDRFLVSILDADGIRYKRGLGGRWARDTGAGVMSMDDYSLKQLFKKGDLTVQVYQSKYVSSGGSGTVRIPERLFHHERLKSKWETYLGTKKHEIKGKVSRTNQEKIVDIKKKLEKKGFREDRWGNWKNKKGTQRIKFSNISFRIERKVGGEVGKYGRKRPIRWIKEGGGYYKDHKRK